MIKSDFKKTPLSKEIRIPHKQNYTTRYPLQLILQQQLTILPKDTFSPYNAAKLFL